MAEFLENMATIRRAIYGKEMRPAIYEALSQNWEAVKNMMSSVDSLNARIDSLPNGGGAEQDNPSDPTGNCMDVIVDSACLAVDVVTPTLQVVAQAILI